MSVRGLFSGGLVWLIASVVCLGVAVFSAAPAGAATKLGLVASFGSFAQPNDLAVDQSSEDVFVADIATNTVYVFHRKSMTDYEPAGEITGSETPAGSFEFHAEEPAPVAVDNSTHTVYVADLDHHVVDKFDLTGPDEYKYECEITGFHAGCHPNLSGEEGTPDPHFGETTGVAVDSHDDVYISDYNHNAVDEFDAAGGDVGQITSALDTLEEPSNLAVDSLGDVYLARFDGVVGRLKVNYLTGEIESEKPNFSPEATRGVAIDPSTNDVYADSFANGTVFSQVSVYEPSGAALLPIVQPGLDSEGLAVNASTHEVYVSDKGNEDVEVFAQVTIPDVITGGSSKVRKTTATVSGSVNPDGAGEAKYFFQYRKSGEEAWLETPEASAGAGTSSEHEEGSLTELAPETTYQYRIVANNANGTNEGKEVTFTTAPAVTMSACTESHPSLALSATLCASIDPEGLETTYYFQYGLKAGEYEATTTVESTGIGPEAEFTAPIAGLHPSTTYHYRLIAENTLGLTTGPDQSLTTTPAEPTVNDQAPFATGVAPHEATLHGTINPGEGITTYHFIYGPTAAYGSSTPEAYTQLNYEDDAVQQLIVGLQPGVTYHYALVATNASGTVPGPDETFTTLAVPVVESDVEQPVTAPQLPAMLTLPSTPVLLPAVVFPQEKPVTRPSPKRPKKVKKRRAHGKPKMSHKHGRKRK